MLEILEILIKVAIFLVVFAISSIPLFIAVKALKGKTTFAEVILVNIILAVIIAVARHFLSLWSVTAGIIGSVVIFALIIVIYKAVFQLGWLRAVLAWFLQFIILAILIAFVLAIEFALGMALMLI